MSIRGFYVGEWREKGEGCFWEQWKEFPFYLGHFWLAVDPSTCLFNHGQLSNLQRLALGLYLGGNFYGKWNGDNEYFDLVCSCNSLLFDKITETFVCSWFFEGCFSVSVITVLYSSRVFFSLGMLLKNQSFHSEWNVQSMYFCTQMNWKLHAWGKLSSWIQVLIFKFVIF